MPTSNRGGEAASAKLNILTAAGNINRDYEVLGMVHSVASRKSEKGGCGGDKGIPVQAVYEDALKGLQQAAIASGANGLIHVQYDHRMSTVSLGCSGTSEPVFEVYASGTAVQLR